MEDACPVGDADRERALTGVPVYDSSARHNSRRADPALGDAARSRSLRCYDLRFS